MFKKIKKGQQKGISEDLKANKMFLNYIYYLNYTLKNGGQQ